MSQGRRFPNEILLAIKEYIPDSDLRTHVCYYNTCRIIAAFYGDREKQEKFFQRTCLLSGINICDHDKSWRDVAFQSIAIDGFCSHPDCGGKLLERNAQQMEQAMKDFRWDPGDGPYYDSVRGENYMRYQGVDERPPVFNHILRSIGFSDEMPDANSQDIVLYNYDRAHYPTFSPGRPSLLAHPIAWRSFATFPSIPGILLLYDDEDADWTGEDEVENEDGVTVREVAEAFRGRLDEDLAAWQLHALLSRPFKSIIPGPGTPFMDNLAKYATMRGLWTRSRLDKLDFEQYLDDIPQFSLQFSPIPRKKRRRIQDDNGADEAEGSRNAQ